MFSGRSTKWNVNSKRECNQLNYVAEREPYIWDLSMLSVHHSTKVVGMHNKSSE